MNTRDAVALLAGAVPRRAGIWADVGAGKGTFTGALAELLGSGSTIYAVDHDARALRSLERSVHANGVRIVSVAADFTGVLDLPKLDGMLLANSLHYVSDPETALSRLVPRLQPGGSIVIIEYDRRAANRWVPYPIGIQRLHDIARLAGLSKPAITATRPSTYGGDLYVAVTSRS